MRFGLREAIFLLVLLAVPAVSLLYVFKPRNEDIRQVQQEIQVKEATLTALQNVTEQFEDLDEVIERGQKAIDMMSQKLPSEQQVELILEQVWLVAKNNDLTVKGVKSSAPLPAADYLELPLNLVMVGEFDGFYQFLLELENLQRITRIHEITMERPNAKSGFSTGDIPPGWMRAEFTLSIYFKPEGRVAE